jgi:ATP-dependent RNA helicase DHX57
VLATNVAETSITIPGIVCVIDTGRVKEVSYDALNHMSRLTERWVSRAASEQRRGRAGRDAPGVCVRLYSRRQYEALDAAPLPEMQRSALDDTCLQLVAMGWSSPGDLLTQCLDPPAASTISSSIQRLCDMMLCNASATTTALELTPLGAQVARLPLDVRLGKALVVGTVLGCVDATLSVVAALAEQSPFRRAAPDREAAVRAARAALQWGQSDHLTLCRLVDEWRSARGRAARRDLAERLWLSFDGMERIVQRRAEFREILQSAGLDAGANANSADPVVIRAALCAGLWPQVARVVYPRRTFQTTAGGAVALSFHSRSVRLFVPATTEDMHRAAAEQRAAFEKMDSKSSGTGTGSSGTGTGTGTGTVSRGYVLPRCIAGARATRAFAHPASSLFHVGDFATPYLMFFEKRATSKTFLQDLSIVPPWALVLFGGSLRVDAHNGLLHVGSHGLISFRAPTKTAVLVAELRKAIAIAVHQGGWTPEQATIAHAVNQLLTK